MYTNIDKLAEDSQARNYAANPYSIPKNESSPYKSSKPSVNRENSPTKRGSSPGKTS